VRLALVNIGQLATCPPHAEQADAGLIDDAALIVADGRVNWSGPRAELPPDPGGNPKFDCNGALVVPGLVDCHTHLGFGGWRGEEFELRLQGRSYQEIAAAGGGIASTVRATREATREHLLEKASTVLDGMLALGVTTVECKSGYGLNYDDELKLLQVYADLEGHAVSLVPTFLGAHIVPPEYRDRRDDYIALLCDCLLPEVARRGLAEFCDVFVEQGAYTPPEARRILAAARDLGLGLKVHADQLSDGGGASLAGELGAVSAEHLEYVGAEGIAALAGAATVAVSLPLASLYLGGPYLPARELLAAGVPVAVATDFNPGTAPSYHLPLAMTLACLKQAMTPQEALMGATTVAARAVARHNRAGSLLAGYPADLAIIEAPDLKQWLYHFRPNACHAVMKAGEWVIPPAAGQGAS
jgi:imidazolonepropionase